MGDITLRFCRLSRCSKFSGTGSSLSLWGAKQDRVKPLLDADIFSWEPENTEDKSTTISIGLINSFMYLVGELSSSSF